MKNKAIFISAISVILIILIAIVVVIFIKMRYFNKNEVVIEAVPSREDIVTVDGKISMYALVDSEDEAEEMADKLGIEFESYSYGVATFLTDQEPDEIIKAAKKKGLPGIEINRIMHLD